MKAVTKTGQDVVEASYKTADGSIVTGLWEGLDAEAVAAGRPWRTFPWYLGQKNYAGLYWCATQNAHVGYESRLELSRLMLADFDPTARKIVSQPFNCEASLRESGFAVCPTTWCAPIVGRLSLM